MKLLRTATILAMVFTNGCQTSAGTRQAIQAGDVQRMPVVQEETRNVPLISAQYETAPREVLVLPFHAGTLPVAPVLKISFAVKSRGHCMQTYEETEILLNDYLLEVLDFRDYEHDQKVELSIHLPLEKIHQGKNDIRIAMGACDYDIDTLQLNRSDISL